MSVAEHDENTKTSENSPINLQNSKDEYKNLKKKNLPEKNQSKQKEFINLINNIMKEIIDDNQRELKENKDSSFPNSVFLMKNLPNIKFLDYLNRINRYLKPQVSTLIISLIYVDRICSEKTKRIVLIHNNIFKIFFSAIVIAIKYNEDFYDDNAYFAQVGGISLKEINILEKEFLDLISFRCFISEEIFTKYNNYLSNY